MTPKRAPWTHTGAWARLRAKVYEIDPLVCPGCMAEQQPQAATRLVKTARAPHAFDPTLLN